MIGFGILLASTGTFLAKGSRLWLRGGIAAAALVAFGSFLLSNVQIHSDFLWYIVLLFATTVTLVATLRKG